MPRSRRDVGTQQIAPRAEQSVSPKSVLVTGANGLIGFDLVRRLRSEGRNVVAVDRSVSDVSTVTDEAFEVEIGDVHKLHELTSRFEIDAVAHCGAVSGPMLGRDNPAMVFRVNVGGTVDVAEVARQVAARRGSCRLVFCSSLTVYGNQPEDDIGEDQPLLTRNCYASSKVAGEAIVLSYAHEHNVDGVVLRIAGVYGPRRRTSCVLRLMVENALMGRPTRLHFGKGFPRQWVHIDDVVQGIVAALDVTDPRRSIYNISGGVNPHIDEAAAIVREFLPSAEIELDPGPDPDDITLGLLSIRAAREDLGYEPTVPLRLGIERLIDSVRLDLGR
jgi:UDP-glucuronate 4-epimerase